MYYRFGWIGYCERDGSDKIWGWLFTQTEPRSLKAGSVVHVFWGRRGKTLNFKSDTASNAMKTAESKNRKGYDRINEDEFRSLWPDFDEMCQTKLTWHVLKSD
jgi:predicted DNA-binding WGR domain protein